MKSQREMITVTLKFFEYGFGFPRLCGNITWKMNPHSRFCFHTEFF